MQLCKILGILSFNVEINNRNSLQALCREIWACSSGLAAFAGDGPPRGAAAMAAAAADGRRPMSERNGV